MLTTTLLDVLEHFYLEIVRSLSIGDKEQLVALGNVTHLLSTTAEQTNDYVLERLADDVRYVLAETSMGAPGKAESALRAIEQSLYTLRYNKDAEIDWRNDSGELNEQVAHMDLSTRSNLLLEHIQQTAIQSLQIQYGLTEVVIHEGPAEVPIQYPANIFGYRLVMKTEVSPEGVYVDVLVNRQEEIVGVRLIR